jgi:hypothetical protein
MKFLRIPALIAITALAFTGCNREGGVSEQSATNTLLAHVPADTPYLFANIEPTPPEVVDAFMVRLAPSFLMAQNLLNDFKLEINAKDPEEHKEARLLSALLAEFDGNMNREGLEKLGLSLESHKVVYGMGIFPVVRIALKDPVALRAAIGRVEENSGIPFTSKKLGETEYWNISGGSNQGGIYIAILEDHVAFSVFPASAEAEWLPAFLGQSQPADSGASAKMLTQLNKDKGYTNYGSGFLDLQKIANEFLNPESKTASLISSMTHYDPQEFGEVCINEVKALVAKAPRLVSGTTELSANAVGMSYELEFESSLAAKLVELVAEVPVADNSADKIFSASLGLRMGRVRNFAREQINALIADPFECEQLKHINEGAKAAMEQMDVPVMPFINNLMGFRVSLDEVDFENFTPEKAKGMFALEVEKPQMLIGMAQMMVPGLGELDLEAGGEPIDVTQELMSFSSNGMNLFVAMGKDSIGVASGENQKEGLAAFMDADEDNGNVFFSVDYDMSAPMQFQRNMQKQFYSTEGGDEAVKEAQELAKSMQDIYMQWLGRTRVEVSFTDDGLEIDTRMTFK